MNRVSDIIFRVSLVTLLPRVFKWDLQTVGDLM